MTKRPTPDSMVAVRADIDKLDTELVKLFAARQRCIERAIAVKAREGIPARVPERVDEVIENARALARRYKADEELIAKIWTDMVEHFIRLEDQTLARKEKDRT